MSEEMLPPGWVQCTLADVGNIVSGGTPSTKNPDFWGGDIRWISPSDLTGYTSKFIDHGAKSITELGLKNSSAKLMPIGSVHFSSRAPIGYVVISSESLCTNQGFKSLVPADGVFNEYVYFYLKSIRALANSLATGTTFKEISGSAFAKLSIPLPPLAEQKRIVAKIEELFSELEAGEESLRVARRQLGVYRQALLKQAFEGKLTATWRTQNPDKLESPGTSDVPADELEGFAELPTSWRYTRFGRFIRHIDAGKSFRCEERRPRPEEIGVAKVSAVTWGEYDEAESKTCIDPERINPAYFIRTGDFILSRANTIELVGASVIVRHVTQKIMLSDKTLRLTMDDALKPFFLQYLRSRQGRREIENRSTGNQESMRNIGQDRIRSIIVPICSLPEQQEIVRLLDEQFEEIERNEREIDEALRKSEALRQSILKKAFSGQLVPQDLLDEPASVLLERIRQTAAAASPSQPKGRRSRASKTKN